MLEGHPSRSPGVPLGYAFIVALLLLDVLFLYLLFNWPITLLSFFLGLATFLSLPAIGFVAYWTAALSRARYLLGDKLQIEWGPFRHELPLPQMQLLNSNLAEGGLASFRGLRWPGYLLGRGRLEGDAGTTVTFFASQPPPEALVVKVGDDLYGLSPQERDVFRQRLASVIAGVGPQAECAVVRHQGWLDWPIWHDRTARLLLVLAPLVNGLHFAVLAGLFPSLPETVPLRMDGAGVVLLSGPPSRLFLPAFFGLLAWLTNAALGLLFYHWRREPVVAYLLWGAGVVVQFAAWASLLLLLP